MGALFALAGKDLRLLVRDRVGMFFALVFPVAFAVFSGLMFSGQGGTPRGVRVVVVDEDGTAESRAFIERLGSGEELEVDVAGRERGLDLVRRGQRSACIILPKGFGERYANPFARGFASVEMAVDPSRKATAAMLEGMLMRCLYEPVQEMFTKPQMMRRRVAEGRREVLKAEGMDEGVRAALLALFGAVEVLADSLDRDARFPGGGEPEIRRVAVARERRWEGPRNAFAVTFPQAAVWGMMGCAAGFGVSMVAERRRGTLLRLRTAPISRWHIVGGKALACFGATLAVATVLILVGVVVFGVEVRSVWLLGLAIVCAAVAFVGLMMALANIGRTEQATAGVGWAVLLLLAMIGGGMIPLFVMPGWMQRISHFSPIKWAIYGLEGALWREFTVAEMVTPCAVLLGVGVVFFSMGAFLFARARVT